MGPPAPVAVVTGPARGIGLTIATRLAESGARLVLAGRDMDLLEPMAERLSASHQPAIAVPVDLTRPETTEALAAAVAERFGRCDVLVNNSGVGGPSLPGWEVPLAQWQATLDVNLTGAFLACKAVLPLMTAQRSGSIVLIGSMTGKRPLLHRSAYAASKLGLLGLCRTLALDAAEYGVRVNTVSPGFVSGTRADWAATQLAQARGTAVETEAEQMRSSVPLGRLVTADDVAEAVLFLSGERAAGITGEDLNVSAGFVMY